MNRHIFCMMAAVVCGVCQGHAGLVFGSSSTSVDIPDNSPDAGAASRISFSAGDSQLSGIANPYVTAMSITFTIAGGWAGDYTLVLKHIDNGVSQSSTLFSSLLSGGAANGGFTGVTLNSSGSPGISTGASSSSTAAITGTFGGVNFSPFLNVAPTGDWLLYVTDNSGGFNGALSVWSLNLEVVPEPINVALGVFGGVMGLVAVARSKAVKRMLTSKAEMLKTES